MSAATSLMSRPVAFATAARCVTEKPLKSRTTVALSVDMVIFSRLPAVLSVITCASPPSSMYGTVTVLPTSPAPRSSVGLTTMAPEPVKTSLPEKPFITSSAMTSGMNRSLRCVVAMVCLVSTRVTPRHGLCVVSA